MNKEEFELFLKLQKEHKKFIEIFKGYMTVVTLKDCAEIKKLCDNIQKLERELLKTHQ